MPQTRRGSIPDDYTAANTFLRRPRIAQTQMHRQKREEMTSPDNMLPRNAAARNISDITDHGPLTPSGTIWPQRQQTDFDRYEDRTPTTFRKPNTLQAEKQRKTHLAHR